MIKESINKDSFFFYPYHIIEAIFSRLNLRLSQKNLKKLLPCIHSYHVLSALQ